MKLSQPQCWLHVLLLGWLTPLASIIASDQELEYKVKAGYLYNFAKFVEWPTTSLASSVTPFVIGVADSGDLLEYWKPLLDGKSVNGHRVSIRAIDPTNVPNDIHILFVSRTVSITPEETRKLLGTAPVLVVGEVTQFAERGGSVGFIEERGAIRITLNLQQITGTGLKVSSKLSSVARIVKDRFSP